jgi:hypothetical protein
MPIEISEMSFEDTLSCVFGEALCDAFDDTENWTVSSTGKVNSQSFRKTAFIEHKIPVLWNGREVAVTLLQVFCKKCGVDIRTDCLTRSKAISPLLEAVSGYLATRYPALKWESDKAVSVREERMSLDDLLA